MKVLAIDSATNSCSVAVLEGQTVAGEQVVYIRKNHSETLLYSIDVLLHATHTALDEVGLIAVSTGPGSFTGLRVGISTAQGLAFSLHKPMVGVSALDIIATQASFYKGFVCPMIDARKQQVYTCLYGTNGCGQIEKKSEATVINPVPWTKSLPEATLFAGSGAAAYQQEICSARTDTALFLPQYMSIPRASTLAVIARARYEKSGGMDPAEIVPRYIRPPDAASSTLHSGS